MSIKSPSDSLVLMNEMVLPNDTNSLNNLMGGRLLHWMDVAGAISAQKHCNSIVVTASVDNVSFEQPIHLGNVVTLTARASRAFNTSVEIFIEVHAEDIPNGKKFFSHSAFLTFVALDKEGNKIQVPDLKPETDSEINLYNSALRRRQMRLILAGKMKPEDATELKSIFDLKTNI